MIAVIDYGVGNLFSLCSALRAIGADFEVTADIEKIKVAERLILPGVGAFADAAAKLDESVLAAEIKREAAAGKPILGICLGMQLLFDKSFEFGEHKGMGLITGEVLPLRGALPRGLKVPHMGWNKLEFKPDEPVFKYLQGGEYVYFVHSYWAKCGAEDIVATAEYGIDVTAVVRCGNVCGMQFHPEKSGEAGMALLRGWIEI